METCQQTVYLEIERKFLVKDIPDLHNGTKIIQAYIFASENKEFRVRIVDHKCYITLKIQLQEKSIEREEYQYEIPLSDGIKMIEHGTIHPPILKIRHVIKYENMTWEVDVFKEENEGLVLAEVEIQHPEQKINIPPWVGKEVTLDKNYQNVNLYQNPYCNWKHRIP